MKTLTWSEEVLWCNSSCISLVLLGDERENLQKLLKRHPDLANDLILEGSYVTIKERAPIGTILAVCASTNHCIPYWVLEELHRSHARELIDFDEDEKERIRECLEATIDCLKASIKDFEEKAERFIKEL